MIFVDGRRWTWCTHVPRLWPITLQRSAGPTPADKRPSPTWAKCAKHATRIAPAARRNCGGTPETSTVTTRTCGVTCPAAAMCADHGAHHHIAGPSGRPPLTCELCGRLSVNRPACYKHVNAAHPEARAAMCGCVSLVRG
uniref:C2H2-type domain-containing protein n=1 Tax=Schizaphis graminum TaxID=13262 RepID=A0A2S2NUU1_SCHGA